MAIVRLLLKCHDRSPQRLNHGTRQPLLWPTLLPANLDANANMAKSIKSRERTEVSAQRSPLANNFSAAQSTAFKAMAGHSSQPSGAPSSMRPSEIISTRDREIIHNDRKPHPILIGLDLTGKSQAGCVLEYCPIALIQTSPGAIADTHWDQSTENQYLDRADIRHT